jgi:molecular chaperone IbpA
MRTYDLNPLWRSTIGFDRLFDLLDETQHRTEDNYPPYNIERLGEDRYHISLALAGFSSDEIAVTAEQNVLTWKVARATRTSTNICIRVSRLGRSNGSSILLITSR